ncbi:MAG: cytochrome c biogenesis CcdA family protein [Anaerolineae bacterium]
MTIDASAVTIPFAILAGLFSFVSPCVLPLVPAYIGYLTSQAANTASTTLVTTGPGGETEVVAQPSRWIVFLHGLFFVLGFAAIFIFLGNSAGWLGQLRLGFVRSRDIVQVLGGILIIVLGLHTMDVIRIPFLYVDTRNQTQPNHEAGYFGSFLMGITFSAGWSPCIGPFLAAMLTLGGSTGSIGRAAVLLGFYALGLGIPFLLAAIAMDRMSGVMASLKKYMTPIKLASGIILIIIVMFVMFGGVNWLSSMFAAGTDLTIMLDEWLVNLATGGE